LSLDRRRFRANVVIQADLPDGFVEDADSAVASVTCRDLRCVMINVDPDTAEKDARVMKAVVGLMKIMRACMYAAVVQSGRIQVGDAVHLIRDDP